MDQELRGIVAEVFDMDPDQVTRDLTPESVDLWDSMNHLRLITEVEDRLRVQFAMAEIQEIDSIGALQDLVARYKSSGETD